MRSRFRFVTVEVGIRLLYNCETHRECYRPRMRSPRALAPVLAIVLALVTARPARADLYHFDQGTAPATLTHPLLTAQMCMLCHSGLLGADGRPYGPSDLWFGSMHGSAARDPLFRATLSVAEQDVPGVGSYCLRCHAPVAFSNGHATAPGASTGAMLDATDLEGVQCMSCHRGIDASAVDPMAPYLGDARLFWDDGTPSKPPPMHGPFDNAAMTPAHTTVLDEFLPSAQMCGQCHEFDNPGVHEFDSMGRDTGHSIMLDTTYSEWAQSTFAGSSSAARSCVDCHMPDQPAPARAANYPSAMPRDGIGRHEFVGGNEFGALLLRTAFPGYNDAAFDRTRAFAQASLQGAATIEVTQAPTNARIGDSIQVTVRVTNLTGHKLPTGFADGRRIWIALDIGGVTVSGDYQSDDIVSDTQLRTYQRVYGRTGQTGPDEHIARQNTVLSDTRIPPLGFVPTPATAPLGRDYTGGASGALRNDDTVAYTVNVPPRAQTGMTTVTARLFYQATTAAYVHMLATDNHTDTKGTEMLDDWMMAGRAAPFEMAHATAPIALEGTPDAGVPAASDAGTVRVAGGGCGCVVGATPGDSAGRSLMWLAIAAMAFVATKRLRALAA